MENLLENEMFCTGVQVGVALYQQKVVTAHERKELLVIGDSLYYLQSSRERLEEILNRICQ